MDRSIGLDKALERIAVGNLGAAQRADDTHRDRVAEHAERVADREHHVGHPVNASGCPARPPEVTAVDLDHGEIGVGIGADQSRRQHPLVGQLHLNLLCALDHVVVGEDEAIGPHDDAGALAEQLLRVAVLVAPKKRWNVGSSSSGWRNFSARW